MLKLVRGSDPPLETITWDNGIEFHGYPQIEQATGIRCYFAYPHRLWQRRSNENFNARFDRTFRSVETWPKPDSITAMASHTNSTQDPGSAMDTGCQSSDTKDYAGCCTSSVNSPL
jgi:IS30 family transposase